MSFTSISGIKINNQKVRDSNRGIILYVGGNGPNNYTTIQGAIEDASDGDTVFVYDDSSPYYENVVVDKSINLRGEDRDTTFIDGDKNGDAVTVTVDWANISGFSIRNCSYYDHGIIIDSTNNNTIRDNIISGNTIGIYLYESINNTISGNHIRSNIFWGIGLDIGANYNTISGNIISDNSIGIFFHHSYNNKITGNYIVSNRDLGIELNFLCNKTIISNKNYAIQDYSNGDNLIYNNFFDNDYNAWDDGENIWNITKTSGINIVGGQWLGGNYWNSYSGEDLDGDGLGDTKLPHKERIKNGGDWLPLTNQLHPPEPPTITGPDSGKSGQTLTYTFNAEDLYWRDVRFHIDWGDGHEEWTIWVLSGRDISVSHIWDVEDTYTITAYTQNEDGENSSLTTKQVTIPRGKATLDILLLRMLERFPLLERLLDVWK
jgi:parallel beta-helix repeat protein